MRLILLLLLASATLWAETYRVEGFGCDKDIEVAKEKALKDAEKKAVERFAGSLIKGSTTIVNYTLFESLIQKFALGKVKVINEEKPEISIADAVRNQVCVRQTFILEVERSKIHPLNLGLQIVLPQTRFKKGDLLRFYLYSSRKCYPYVFDLSADGRVYRIIPNRFQKSRPLKGRLTFPPISLLKMSIAPEIYPVPGKPFPQAEELLFICSLVPIKAFEDEFQFPTPYLPAELPYKTVQMLLKEAKFGTAKDKLYQVLNQVGLDKFDMTSTVYYITDK